MVKPVSRPLSQYSLDALALLGQLVREARLDKAMTTADLAARAGISRALLQRIERLDTAETPHDKSQVMNWALNALACNITPNLRLDLIANAQAELASVAK